MTGEKQLSIIISGDYSRKVLKLVFMYGGRFFSAGHIVVEVNSLTN